MANAVSKPNSSHVVINAIDPARAFLVLFPLSAVLLFMALPSAQMALATSIALSILMVVSANNATSRDDALEEGQGFVTACAPVHFALVLWVCVGMARHVCDLAGLAGAAHFSGVLGLSLAGMVAFLALEFLACMGISLLLERGRGTAGAGFAALVSARYAGALGRVI